MQSEFRIGMNLTAKFDGVIIDSVREFDQRWIEKIGARASRGRRCSHGRIVPQIRRYGECHSPAAGGFRLAMGVSAADRQSAQGFKDDSVRVVDGDVGVIIGGGDFDEIHPHHGQFERNTANGSQ